MLSFAIAVALTATIIISAFQEGVYAIQVADAIGDEGSKSSGSGSRGRSGSKGRTQMEEENFLFPNQTKMSQSSRNQMTSNFRYDESNRLLSFDNAPAPKSSVLCKICSNLQTCQILNNLLIQEVYYPVVYRERTSGAVQLGTCEIIEQRGVRLSLQIFGPDKTFRDTPTCRDIVMQYLCLFWASDNSMYTNFCFYQQDVKDSDPKNHKLAPLAPCRSFCVQVSSVCANDPDQFYFQCGEIVCPPTSDTCTPDPVLGMQSLEAGLGCFLPFYKDPYAIKSSASKLSSGSVLCVFLVLLLLTSSLLM